MTNPYPAGSSGVPDSSMPTGSLGFMPRRSSYASVVSGSLTGAPYQQPARSGAFSHLLNQNTDFNYDSYPNMNTQQRHDPRPYDMDFNTSGSSHGRSGSWGRSGHLHPFSSAFAGVMNGTGYGGFGGSSMDQFFIPSYLKRSQYVQKLEEAHKAKIAAHKDGQSAPSSQPGSLSTSASSVNLHTKMGGSYRGIAHDVIEKAPPVEDETLTPLPSKWNTLDKYGGLEVLNDGLEVKFSGPKSERDRDHEACAIRADYPMPSQCGIYYFEVDIVSRKREESSIGIGFSTKNVPLSRLPGWEPESYAYHGDDGHSFCCQSSGKHYGPPFNAGDVIGCGINFRTGCAFFTKNGDNLGTAFRDIKESKGKLFPSVGMKKAGEHVRVNFGQRPFVFDIDGMMSASNSFSYPHPSILSDTPEIDSNGHENGGQSVQVPSLDLNATSIPEHRGYVAAHLHILLSAPSEGSVTNSPESPSPQNDESSPSADSDFQDLVSPEPTHPTVEQSVSIHSCQEINTSGPVTEETLGPFETIQEARDEGRRRQREAASGSLDTPTSRPYIASITMRTRRGYETTLYTWYHPLISIIERRSSSALSVTLTPSDTDLDINGNETSTNERGTPINHYDHLDMRNVLVTPLSERSERVNEVARSYMDMAIGHRRERRPTISYQDFVVEQRAHRGQNRHGRGRQTTSPNHRYVPSRSPRRPPSGGMPGSSRSLPYFPGVRPRERGQGTNHQQSVSGAETPDIFSLAEFPPLRPPVFALAEPPLSALIDAPLSWEIPTPPLIQETSSRRARDRILHRSTSQNQRDLQAIRDEVDRRLAREISLAIRDASLDFGHERTTGHQILTRGQNWPLESERFQGRSGRNAQEIMSGHGNEQPSEPAATNRSTPSGDHSQSAGTNVTVLPVRISGLAESQSARAAIESAESAILRAQTARVHKSWLCQEIAKRLSSLEIQANLSSQREQKQIRQEIEATSTAKLAPPMDETELIQALILQALAHDGYVETARAFAEEVRAEKKALSLDPNEVVEGLDIQDDEDAGHRQRIRTAVLEGDVDRALKYTNAYYPSVLKDNEHVYFRLRCRKFIEMVRQAAEVQNASAKIAKKRNGHNGDYYDDGISHDMELDDHPNSGNYDRMDTEELPESQNEHLRLLQETLVYGAELQAEFKDDPRREVKKGLDDIFALMAYQDPLNAKQVSHFLDPEGRMAVAEELNSAILLSLGKSSSAALERLYQQTYVLLEDLREGGGNGALVNIDDFVRPKTGP